MGNPQGVTPAQVRSPLVSVENNGSRGGEGLGLQRTGSVRSAGTPLRWGEGSVVTLGLWG